jgi:hypothetical protein
MKSLIALIFLLVTSAYAIEPQIEKSVDLGNGFRRVTIAESSNSTFESIGHFEYLFYKDRKISQLGVCSISKNGTTAIYQDAKSGYIYIFKITDSAPIQITNWYFGPVSRFFWKDNPNEIDLELYDHPNMKFPLKIQTEQGAAANP